MLNKQGRPKKNEADKRHAISVTANQYEREAIVALAKKLNCSIPNAVHRAVERMSGE